MLFIVAPPGSGGELLASMLPGPPRVVATVAEGLAVDAEARFVYVYRDPSAAATAEETAQAWARSTEGLLDELETLAPERWCVTSYDRLIADREGELARISNFAGIEARPRRATPEEAQRAASRARELFAKMPGERVRVERQPPSFESVHTSTLAEILYGLRASLIVTTYQSGRVILVRAQDAKTLNTHFRTFPMPMGVAMRVDAELSPTGQKQVGGLANQRSQSYRLALGTRTGIWDYRNQPDLAPKIEPKGTHDACLVPRNMHVTGDIRVHELAFADDELWLVNTRFSALCTIDRDRSFVPRWRPPFVTKLVPEDRCHLNGMCIVDSRIAYVTALGETDSDNGWRENKARGGIVIDVASGETILRGLSMPHSPRFHDGRLWLLESGKGTLSVVEDGTVRTVTELPGFTRGLAFAGPFAFVGLSQVRESNIFGGIPLVDRVPERRCGVWVVDTRTGNVVAFLRFEGTVQEIFDVQVLHGVRYPELLEPTNELVGGSFTL